MKHDFRPLRPVNAIAHVILAKKYLLIVHVFKYGRKGNHKNRIMVIFSGDILGLLLI
jgi:hypothetical protein